MLPLSIHSRFFLGSFFMPLVSVKFSDHCHFLHFSAELPALGGKKTFAVWYSIVFDFPMCRDIFDSLCAIIFPPVARSLAHTITKKKLLFWQKEIGQTCLFSVSHSSYLEPTLPALLLKENPTVLHTGTERDALDENV